MVTYSFIKWRQQQTGQSPMQSSPIQWTSDDIKMIAWSSFGKAAKRMNKAENIITINNIFGWDNTRKYMKQIYNTPDIFPVCKQMSETATHIYICPKQIPMLVWSLCKEALERIHTVPPLMTNIQLLLLQTAIHSLIHSNIDNDIFTKEVSQRSLGLFSGV